ncbi:MAG: phosphotransferase [Candidatus Cryptobacteroides sp.]
MENTLPQMFVSLYGAEPQIRAIGAASGSARRYFRLTDGEHSAIGVIGTSREENASFISLARHFRSKGIPVPEIFAVSPDMMTYLQEDLGDESLFDKVSTGRDSGCYSPEEEDILKKTVSLLPLIQLKGAEGLDFSVCYPEAGFTVQQAMFDLQYFKYCFLKPSGIEFRESLLEHDFMVMAEDLQDDTPAFMYRDFQARNIMIRDGKPYFIDFQGGRRGPLQYDIVSFVWQARSRFPRKVKQDLVDAYLDSLSEIMPLDREAFLSKMDIFVLFRTLQVLAAYGFRGNYQRKSHFLKSIPFALDNLREILANSDFPRYPYLVSVLKDMLQRQETSSVSQVPEEQAGCLTVEVLSFSYKKGLPQDVSGNGGGYIFDCRSIHNPGRYEQYRNLTGMDREVVDFLETDGEVTDFLSNVYKIVGRHVDKYLKRGFTHLQVAFGCTGGQHRSVYCAEKTAEMIAGKYGVRVILRHRERGVERILKK